MLALETKDTHTLHSGVVLGDHLGVKEAYYGDIETPLGGIFAFSLLLGMYITPLSS